MNEEEKRKGYFNTSCHFCIFKDYTEIENGIVLCGNSRSKVCGQRVRSWETCELWEDDKGLI